MSFFFVCVLSVLFVFVFHSFAPRPDNVSNVSPVAVAVVVVVICLAGV